MSAAERLCSACARGDEAEARRLLPGVALDECCEAAGKRAPLHCAAAGGSAACAALLLDAGAKVDALSRDQGSTPLLLACDKGHVEVAGLLLERGADANIARGSEYDADVPSAHMGSTPLIVACAAGNAALVRLLLSAGADPDKLRVFRAITPLYACCESGTAEVAELLLGAGVDAREFHVPESERSDKYSLVKNTTPLLVAVKHCRSAVAEVLLRAGVDVEQTRDADGETALSSLCADCCYSAGDTAAVLLAHGANVLHARKDEETPLSLAIEKGSSSGEPKLVAVLLRGLDVNAPCHQDGTTPLLLAVKKENLLKMLLDSGADPNGGARTALCRACELCNDNIVKLLLERGADVNRPQPADGRTPMHFACARGSRDLVATLLKAGAGASVSASSRSGATPLHRAAAHNFVSVVELLLDAGAELNARRSDGTTPLACACASGAGDAGELLLRRGASPNGARDRAPLTLALSSGMRNLAQMLLRAGADPFADGSPLCVACLRGDLDFAMALVRAGAPLQATGPNGSTPLLCAARRGRTDVVAWLLRQLTLAPSAGELAAALCAACENCHTETTTALLGAGADPNSARTGDGASPLILICRYRGRAKHAAAATALLDAGADPCLAASGGHRDFPLFDAARRGDSALVQILLARGADAAQVRVGSGDAALHAACAAGRAEVVHLLLRAPGGNATASFTRTADCATPLMLAALEGHTEVVRAVAAAGVAVCMARTDGTTALHLAAAHGRAAAAEALLAAGADFREDKSNRTPLHIACQHGHAEVAKVLAAAASQGVAATRTKGGATAAALARARNSQETLRALLEFDITPPITRKQQRRTLNRRRVAVARGTGRQKRN
eukprot:TRINITY_DN1621_c0_g1_i1.p1 TRINITY_DN1621_c0_g1~~TRINITY_DN1621_c0_g1_i1.p1  ORF type:complete len:855 (+),score=180.12 TRINITY_DN1621_c0_g1_i1:37-2601(+)